MAEKQGDHRRDQEKQALQAEIVHMEKRDEEAKLGQIFAFVIAIFTLTLGGYLANRGAEIWRFSFHCLCLCSRTQKRKNLIIFSMQISNFFTHHFQ
jgi:uncharacterized membrane protein